jgi:hypothetical protein
VLPLRRAEELIATLPGVLSVRIVPLDSGGIDEIHVLTTDEVAAKHMVRNIESALMAQLGLRINHRKVSIAQSMDPLRAVDGQARAIPAGAMPTGAIPGVASPEYVAAQPAMASPMTSSAPRSPSPTMDGSPSVGGQGSPAPTRGLLFEDVEVRRSRTRGASCRVILRRDGQEYVGEAEGPESERARLELAARASVAAIAEAVKATPGATRGVALEGATVVEAFDREFVFVSVLGRAGRETAVLTGSSEVRESLETSAVLAVLDATNRWLQFDV